MANSRMRQRWRRRHHFGQKGLCYFCKHDLILFEKVTEKVRKKHYSYATIDHLIPLARGGKDNFENTAVVCHPCNFLKGNMTATEFLSRFFLPSPTAT